MTDPTEYTHAQVLGLLHENEVLRHENAELRAALAPVATWPQWWHLSPMEARLLTAIRAAAPYVCTSHRAMLGMYGPHEQDWPEEKCLQVYICKLRRKLAAIRLPVEIVTVRSTGYRIGADGADHLDAAQRRDVSPSRIRYLAAAE